METVVKLRKITKNLFKIDKNGAIIRDSYYLQKKIQELTYYAECPTWMFATDVVNKARIELAYYKRLLNELKKEDEE